MEGVKMEKGKHLGKGMLGGIILFLLATSIAMATHTLTSASPTVDVKDALRFVNRISKWIIGNNSLKVGSVAQSCDSLPLWFRLTDSLSQPVEGLACTLSVGSRKIVRVSDDFGEILFWVPRPRLFTEVELTAHPDRTVKLNTSFTSSSNANARGGFETGEGLLALKDDGIKVLYPAEYEAQGREMLAALKQEKQIIHNLTGMQLGLLKVIISTSDPKYGVGGWVVSPANGTVASIAEFYRFKFTTLPHEWVEGSLSSYGVYKEIEEELFPEMTRFSRVESKDTSKVYDLRTWIGGKILDFGGGSVGYKGYDLAPYFWAKVMDKSGDSLIISKFLEEFRKAEDKSSWNAIAILSGLSGLDINKELVITGKEYLENVNRYWTVVVSRDSTDWQKPQPSGN
jgi:hypothetical protein